MKFNTLLFFACAIALASCVDIPDFSDTPRIYYNGIDQRTEIDTVSGVAQETEIVTVTIDFEDGDGDLGISDDQRNDSIFTKQYERIPNWGLRGNYELVTMTKQRDSSWVETILTGDKDKFFLTLKPDGKPGPIKGKLDLNIRFLKSRSTVLRKVKYKIRIMDNAFHISNQTEPTDEVTVPVLP